jgi:hypothetical protein
MSASSTRSMLWQRLARCETFGHLLIRHQPARRTLVDGHPLGKRRDEVVWEAL